MIKDRRVVRTFDIPQTNVLAEKKLRLKKQGDTRERPNRKAFTGGVVEVRSHKRGTMNKIVYENMKTETLTTQQLLERETFFDDPRRAARLRELERQALDARDWPQSGPVRTAQRKHRRTSRSHRPANRDPCGNLSTLTNTDNSEGFMPPTGWSWTRPGLPIGIPECGPADPRAPGRELRTPSRARTPKRGRHGGRRLGAVRQGYTGSGRAGRDRG